jgi:hypothetical protein
MGTLRLDAFYKLADVLRNEDFPIEARLLSYEIDGNPRIVIHYSGLGVADDEKDKLFAVKYRADWWKDAEDERAQMYEFRRQAFRRFAANITDDDFPMYVTIKNTLEGEDATGPVYLMEFRIKERK